LTKRVSVWMKSARNLELALSSAWVVPLPSRVELSALRMGKNRAVPAGG